MILFFVSDYLPDYLPNLQTVKISVNNNFKCDCNTLTNLKRMENIISEYSFLRFECGDIEKSTVVLNNCKLNIVYIIAAVSTFASFTILSIFIFVYRSKMTICHIIMSRLYDLSQFQWVFMKETMSKTDQHEAFIISHDGDYQILEEMVSVLNPDFDLESNVNFEIKRKFDIATQNDFTPGENELSQFIKFMKISQRVVFLISKSFINSSDSISLLMDAISTEEIKTKIIVVEIGDKIETEIEEEAINNYLQRNMSLSMSFCDYYRV